MKSNNNLECFIKTFAYKETELETINLYFKFCFSVYYIDSFLCRSFGYKTKMSNTDTVTTLERLANLLRIHSIESTQEANSGLVKLIHSLNLIFYFH